MNKFKIGDWVTVKGTLLDNKFHLTAKEVEHGKILLAHFRFGIDKWEPWQPREGEWCWFKTDKSFKLVEYDTPTFNQAYYYGLNPIVEPFIGELSSFIKE